MCNSTGRSTCEPSYLIRIGVRRTESADYNPIADIMSKMIGETVSLGKIHTTDWNAVYNLAVS